MPPHGTTGLWQDLSRIYNESRRQRLQRAERIVRGWRPTFGTVHAEGDLLDVSTRALEGNGEAARWHEAAVV
jgi:hypothetical protein